MRLIKRISAVPNRLRQVKYAKFYLTSIGLVTLVILIFSIVYFVRERQAIKLLSRDSIQLEGERLAIEIERQSLQAASACLADSSLRTLAGSLPGDGSGSASFRIKSEKIAKHYPIVDNFFVMVNGAIFYPPLQAGASNAHFHKQAQLINKKLKGTIDPGPFLVNSQSIFVEGVGIPFFYTVLTDSPSRRILAFTAKREWIEGPLLAQCQKNIRTGVGVGHVYTIGPHSKSEEPEHAIPFNTVFPFWELRMPQDAGAAGKSAAIVQMALIGGSAILMLCLFILIVVLILRVSKEQLLIQTRSDFFSHISHELKTPLTLILLYVDNLLSDAALSEEDRNYSVRVISRESERLSHLIDNLLHLSRIERAKDQYKIAEGNLAPIIEKTVAVCTEWLKMDGISISTYIQPDLPPVLFDLERISQAFMNLIDNARKYAGNSKTIKITLWSEGSSVILEVRDNGIGISDADQKKIFERYYRGSNASAQRGSGLGLFLIREIMQAHKGTVEVDSVIGKGSRFRLIFPACPSTKEALTGITEEHILERS